MDGEIRANLQYQLGLSLRKQRRYGEALAHLETANPSAATWSRSAALEKANVLQHLGNFRAAADAYEKILTRAPLDLEVHVHLNELLYRTKQDENLFASYDRALLASPKSAILPATKGHYLLKLGRPQEALEAFGRALSIAGGLPIALTGKARALERLGDHLGARSLHQESLIRSRDDPDALEDYASFLLRSREPEKARVFAEKACRARPTSQGAWAILGLCYRAEDNSRDAWLNDYEKHIRVFDLDPPDGYTDMVAFNKELALYLSALHADDREYLTQTLRGGTRIYDEVFYNGHKLIDLLLPRISQAIHSYVSAWKDDATHPFSSRRTNAIRFAGSWSSRMKENGYHVNHIHQMGWISSSYYVSVPDMAAGSSEHQGWIKFGQPSEDFGAEFSPQRFVEPRAGRLVLFPSYMWHGTMPFQSPQERLTIAFDAIPT